MSHEVKHAKVLELVQQGLPAYKAYMKVYPDTTEENAMKNCWRIFKTENEGMRQALEEVGLDNKTLAGEFKTLLDDSDTKGKALDMISKIKGAYSPTKSEAKIEGNMTLTDYLQGKGL